MRTVARRLSIAGPLLATLAATASAQMTSIDPRAIDVLDFEGLPAGTILDSVHGRFGAGPIEVYGINPVLAPANAALIFDSSNPTGGDPDLGSPNEDFGGPGIGLGGSLGSPFQNDQRRNRVLIVGDNLTDMNGDLLVDNPGDTNELGSALVLDFSAVAPVTMRSITILDIESGPAPAFVDMLDDQGFLLDSVFLPVIGDNGLARVDLGGVSGVSSIVVTLNGSAAIDDVLFELPPDGIIGDRVWHDLDADGIQDPGEPGIPGVTLTLSGVGPGVDVAVTDASGSYTFSPVTPGPYVLQVDESTLPSGLTATLCDVGGNDEIDSECSPFALDLAANQLLTSVDFGFVDGCDGAIGDFCFLDVNGDNVQDAGDTGLANVTLRLYDGMGNLIATEVSDANGAYLFTGLCPGDYIIEPDLNAGLDSAGNLGPSICNAGPDQAIDSECGPVCISLFNIASIEQNVTIDFGYGVCGDCDGKVDALSLRYLGQTSAFIEVQQHQGQVVFADVVEPDDVFSFFGVDNQSTLGPKIFIFEDNIQVEAIHTSCSQPIFIGMVQGDFEVVAGSSRHGGAFCGD